MAQIINLSTLLTPFTPGGSWFQSSGPITISITGNNATFGDCVTRGQYIFTYTLGTPPCTDSENVIVNVEDSLDDTVTPAAIKITCGVAAPVNITHIVLKKCPGSPGSLLVANIVITGPGGYTQTLLNQNITLGSNQTFSIINPVGGTYCIDIIPQGADANVWCNWQECFVLEASPDVCPATCNGPFTLCPEPPTYDLSLLFNGGSYPPGTVITYQQTSGTPTLSISGSIVTLPSNTTTGSFTFRKIATWTATNGTVFTWVTPSCNVTWATQTCTFTPSMWLYPGYTIQNQSFFTVEPDEVEFGGLVNFQVSNSCNSGLFQQGPYPRTTGQIIQYRTGYICLILGSRLNQVFLRTGTGGGSWYTLGTTITYNGSNAIAVRNDIQGQLDILFNSVNGVADSLWVDPSDLPTGINGGSDPLCSNCGGSTGYAYMRFRIYCRVKHQPTSTWYGFSKLDTAGIAEVIIVTPPNGNCTAGSTYIQGIPNSTPIKTNGSTNTVTVPITTAGSLAVIGACNLTGTLTISEAIVALASDNITTDYNFVGYTASRNMIGTFTGSSVNCTTCT